MVSELNAFDLEEPEFHGQAAAETANRAVAGNDAMARDDNGNGICAASHADRLRGPGFANLLCNPTVGPGFAARYPGQCPPDRLLENCAGRDVERNAPAYGFAGGVLFELPGEFADK